MKLPNCRRIFKTSRIWSNWMCPEMVSAEWTGGKMCTRKSWIFSQTQILWVPTRCDVCWWLYDNDDVDGKAKCARLVCVRYSVSSASSKLLSKLLGFARELQMRTAYWMKGNALFNRKLPFSWSWMNMVGVGTQNNPSASGIRSCFHVDCSLRYVPEWNKPYTLAKNTLMIWWWLFHNVD